MNNSISEDIEFVRRAKLDQIEAQLGEQFRGRARNLRLLLCGNGVLLCGEAYSFHAKQLVQHEVMQASDLPLISNEIAVVE